MNHKLLILAVVIPLLCFLLAKYQDGDFNLMFYEIFGKDATVALKGKVVWITGASSGIGEYLAYELSKCGCKLVLSARRKEQLERVKEKCAAISSALDPSFQKDQDILVLPLDLLQLDTHENLAKDVIKHFGKIDILVNNTGRLQMSLVKKTSLEVDRAVIDLNTIGTISLTKAVLPHMIECRQGQIVVVSSVLGKFGFPYQASYAASKHALQGYFDTARLELAEHNIGVQIICPGPVESSLSENAFSEDVDVPFKDSPSYDLSKKMMPYERMFTDRCTSLMTVSMANNLEEVWIAEQPTLGFVYINQYFPHLSKWYVWSVRI
ncbi:PREDICTED: dehydrogenase/reductase SDR family member 7-like [Acropora digitifera]|uniref:dehydrogenase/reductase SDR family member 7-like n=1 Tax=Acropora digitifera TaxID=70779 RepID=UPI00077A06F5|nr:PREDICTED: dehydrogenase/reductase SDR family member 7-like [Acropora digitifera]